MRKKYKAIIFDLDNTLYDFSSAWLKAFYKIHSYFGLDNITTKEKFFEIFKKYDTDIIDAIHRGEMRIKDLRDTRVIKTMNYFGKNFTSADASEFYEKMFDFILESIEEDKEIVSLLKKLKKKYKIYLLTNGIAKEQQEKLRKLNIENIFDGVYISSVTNINKPNIRAYLQILAPNKIFFDEVLMVGDSLFHDIVVANKLGIDTIHIKKEWHLTDLTPNLKYSGESKENIKDVLEMLV